MSKNISAQDTRGQGNRKKRLSYNALFLWSRKKSIETLMLGQEQVK
jgi:hypothetical protein